jgi:hypothetical protein
VLEALDVDVARAALHRLGEDRVDEPHHRRLVDRPRRARAAVVLAALQAPRRRPRPRRDLGEEGLHLRLRLLVGAGGLVVPVDQRAQRVLAGDDREDVVAGDELEVVEDAGVGRVGEAPR